MAASSTVLVTGGTGFIATYAILQLLQKGYNVHTTVRSLSREAEARNILKGGGAPSDADERLTFFAAELGSDGGWTEAVKGCEYVLHVASPFPLKTPKTEDELIVPAREGTLRVLRAARDAGVKRVVLTSSFAAVGYGWPASRTEAFTEKDWSVLDGSKDVEVPMYHKSKAVAERAAWDFINKDGKGLELATVNPVGVLGPVLGKDAGTSVQIVKKLMDGSMPGCPQVTMGFVDVRDVADLHIRAMTNPNAKGERFLAVADNGVASFLDIANVIRAKRPENAKKVPTRELPNILVKVMACFDAPVRQLLSEMGRDLVISNEKAKSKLGWAPMSKEDSIADTVDSLVKAGLV